MSLRPRICLTGWVSVGVQLVICTSSQHQLQIKKTSEKKTVTQRFHVSYFCLCRVKIFLDAASWLTPLSVQSTQNTLSSWAARSYRGVLQLQDITATFTSQLYSLNIFKKKKHVQPTIVTKNRQITQKVIQNLIKSISFWQRQEAAFRQASLAEGHRVNRMSCSARLHGWK